MHDSIQKHFFNFFQIKMSVKPASIHVMSMRFVTIPLDLIFALVILGTLEMENRVLVKP